LKKNRRKQSTKRFVPSGDVVTMTAADSVVSCRRRSPLCEPILSRVLKLNHRAMPRTRDPTRARFTEIEEQYQDELTGQTKTRVKCKCEFGCAFQVRTTWPAPRKGSASVSART
jgi:hypothetical protein